MDRLVPQIDEEIVEGVQNIPQESILERVEQIIVVRVPRVSKELVEGGTPVPQARETVAQLGDVPIPRVMKE